MKNIASARIAVLGLGYVGLPLAVAFSAKYPVIGFDINPIRINELAAGYDRTLEVSDEELAGAENLTCTSQVSDLKSVNTFIVTTPTPIDRHKRPDLGPLLAASRTIGSVLKMGDTVIYESTVYPGATEEQCVPILEEVSGLKLNVDFFVGYSPERINPGDKEHRFTNITKVTSGSTPESAEYVDLLYGSVVAAGTHLAPSIRVAEAAKVIENTQRDVNIALINELSLLFNRMGIDTKDVLDAAGTKWNFLNFKPGLVGGHCIGVDPYYLTHKAQEVGFHPELILAGRRINDSMGAHVAAELVKRLASGQTPLPEARVLVLGLTFKEDTPDLRNTRVIDIIRELRDFGIDVDVHDSMADPQAARQYYGIKLVPSLLEASYDGVVLAVPHKEYLDLPSGTIRSLLKDDGGVLFDLKSRLPRRDPDFRL